MVGTDGRRRCHSLGMFYFLYIYIYILYIYIHTHAHILTYIINMHVYVHIYIVYHRCRKQSCNIVHCSFQNRNKPLISLSNFSFQWHNGRNSPSSYNNVGFFVVQERDCPISPPSSLNWEDFTVWFFLQGHQSSYPDCPLNNFVGRKFIVSDSTMLVMHKNEVVHKTFPVQVLITPVSLTSTLA